MRRYVAENGGLTVEKYESTTPKTVLQERSTREIKDVSISGDKVIETLHSYMIGTLSKTPTENGGNACVVCGKHIDYDNRYICYDCFRTYGNDIIESMKQANKETEIKII